MPPTTSRLLGALLVSVSLVSCQDGDGQLASIVDAAALPFVGEARAATPPPGQGIWRERTAADPLPAGFTPPQSLAPLIKTLKPGVVNVYTTSIVRMRTRQSGPFQDPFEEFFRRFHQGAPESRRQSLGSGFIINPSGLVLTNNHVVDGADEIKIRLDDGREFEAETVGRDPKTDVALLKLKGNDLKDLPSVFLGNSDGLEVGDYVIAVGNPFGLDHSVSLGIVSAKERVIGAGPYDDFIQTDAAINPGNSGGPLFNARGEVVGVNTAIVSQGQGIGFAVPVNMVKDLLPQLQQRGRIVRGWLGVSIQDVTPELARTFKLDRPRGALIAGVMKKSPAEAAGLKAGDVVVGVNGHKVDTYSQLSRHVAFIPPGGKAELRIVRDGKEKAVILEVGQRPEDEALAAGELDSNPEPAGADALGIEVQPLTAQKAQRLGIERGVAISAVKQEGPAARAGARIGDVIVEVQRQPVASVKDYVAAVSSLRPGDLALIRVQRENAAVYIAVKMPAD